MTKIILISVAIAVLGFMPLMGLPGVLVILFSKPVIFLLHGPMAYEAFTQSIGDKTWPLMLMLSILWPISIPVAYMLCQKIFGDLPFFSIGFFLPFCVFVLLGTTIIATLTVQMSVSPRRLSDGEVLEQALKNGKFSLVEKYWNAANTTTFSFDPLYVALENNQDEVAIYLLDQGVNPQKYSQNVEPYTPGITPLHTATKNARLETIKKLLHLGADPNATSDYGQTPLHIFGEIDKTMLPVLELFKENGANFAAVDQDGNTPLITLSSINAPLLEDRPLLAKKLIEYGCPRDFKNKKGETALSIVQRDLPYEKELMAVLSGAGSD